MGKNNRLINQMRAIAAANKYDSIGKAADQILPSIYAALAISLHRKYGWGYKRINRLFVESQEVWNEHVQRNDEASMVELCKKETGIDVVGTTKGDIML